jgi:hypothetical protein
LVEDDTTDKAAATFFEDPCIATATSSKRRASGTWSIASIAESIFSLESGMTQSSASSVKGSQEMIERLVGLFLEDTTIKGACLRALDAVARDRFERNLRRLLMIFASKLRVEAKTEDERNAARFVKHRATNSAHMICNRLNRTVSSQKNVEMKDEFDEPDDESDSDMSEGDIDDLHHLETFIKSSKALNYLKTALEVFVQRLVDAETANEARIEKGDTQGRDNIQAISFNDSKKCIDIPQGGNFKLLNNAEHLRGQANVDLDLILDEQDKEVLNATKSDLSHFGPVKEVDGQLDHKLPSLRAVTADILVDVSKQNKVTPGVIRQFNAYGILGKWMRFLEQLGIVRPTLQSGHTRIEWQCVSIGIPIPTSSKN